MDNKQINQSIEARLKESIYKFFLSDEVVNSISQEHKNNYLTINFDFSMDLSSIKVTEDTDKIQTLNYTGDVPVNGKYTFYQTGVTKVKEVQFKSFVNMSGFILNNVVSFPKISLISSSII